MRNAEVIRQWKILKTIEAGRYTSSAKLADEHGVTERTIRRDIEALQEAGFPLYDDRADGRKVWRLVEGYKQRLTQSFTLAELAALYFGKNMLSFLGGAPFAQDLESAFAKIREALPAKSLPYLSRIQDLFSARPDPWKDYSKKQDVIAALIDAILHQRQARSPTSPSTASGRSPTRSTPTGSSTTAAGSTSTRAPTSTARCGPSRSSASSRSRCWTRASRCPADFSVSEYARGAFGIAAGKAETVELLFDGRDGRLHPRARSGTRARRSRTSPTARCGCAWRSRPSFELKSWIKGFLPHVAGGAAGVAARRDRARARGGRAPTFPAPGAPSGR